MNMEGDHFMTFFLTYDIHLFSLILLSLILVTMRVKGDFRTTSNKLFRRLVIYNMYMLVLEVISWQFDGKSGTFNYYANYISNMLFAWSGPVISCLWVTYIDYHMYRSYDRIKKHFYFLHPMILLTLFMIINLFTPFIFSVNEQNVYSREPFMWLIIVVNSMAVIYKWVDVYRHKKQASKELVTAMMLYILLPAVAAAIQVVVYGAFIVWPIMAITIVLTYFYLDTISTSRDYLTRLMSRQFIDNTIEYLMTHKETFTIIMIDLNKFKAINDNHGHVVGDEALVKFASALKSVFCDIGKIGRFAGDEFIVIIDDKDAIDVNHRMNALESLLEKYNEDNCCYTLSFSYGAYDYEQSSTLTPEQLIHKADEIMYQKKRGTH